MNYFHKVTSSLINHCVMNGIKEIVIGYNKNWKNNVNLGRKNNDMFYKIPYCRLIHMLFYKGENKGIVVSEHEEAYTSKCDALAFEKIGFNDKYSGERITRDLFSSQKNTNKRVIINADVNGAINILRKKLKHNAHLLKCLKSIIKIRKLVCNPKKVKLNSPPDSNIKPGRAYGM